MGKNFFFVPTTSKPTPIPVNVDRKKLATHLPATTCPMLKLNKNGIMANKILCLYSGTKVKEFLKDWNISNI
jgi:hypothetical protein